MQSHRRVVCLELRKLAHGVVVKRVTTRRCGSGQRRCRRQCVAMIMGLALQSLCVVYGAQPAAAQVEKAAGEVKRPAYQIGSAGQSSLRFNEDWSVLKGVDLSKTDDFWDRLKYIPLTPDQSVWLDHRWSGP